MNIVNVYVYCIVHVLKFQLELVYHVSIIFSNSRLIYDC
jgi:hypothetical protein